MLISSGLKKNIGIWLQDMRRTLQTKSAFALPRNTQWGRNITWRNWTFWQTNGLEHGLAFILLTHEQQLAQKIDHFFVPTKSDRNLPWQGYHTRKGKHILPHRHRMELHIIHQFSIDWEYVWTLYQCDRNLEYRTQRYKRHFWQGQKSPSNTVIWIHSLS